jgi:hypothetical protein
MMQLMLGAMAVSISVGPASSAPGDQSGTNNDIMSEQI